MIKNRKLLITIISCFICVLILSKCINSANGSDDPRGNVYAGSGTCRQCHQAIYDSFSNTTHSRASALATDKNILGNFTSGANVYVYDASTKVAMEKRANGNYQVFYKNAKEIAAYKMDIVFGSKHAQTYLYWAGNKAHELPVSHYTSINNWATSPGFSANTPNFTRFIGSTCFSCHSSFVESKMNTSMEGITEEFANRNVIYGIDCERCHGPAINHVNWHTLNPGEKIAKYLRTNASLSQQQKLDACAVCHGGNDQTQLMSRFDFKMGDTLANYFIPSMMKKRSGFDVHGNQAQLLAESKCFLNSKVLTCNTCHDPHTNADDNVATYSQKCMSCHKEADHTFCPMASSIGESIKNNCIDCHMPKQPSQAITFQTSGSKEMSAYLLRTHKIGLYLNDKDSIAKRNITAVNKK